MKRGKLLKDRYLWVAGILGLILYLIFAWMDPTLRQTAAVDREQAMASAAAFWKQQGIDTAVLQSTVLMQSDTLADGYLGKEKLRDEFERVMTLPAPMVYWTVSFYEGDGDDSYLTKIDPDSGAIVSWQRMDAAGTRDLEEAEAKQLAMQALQAAGIEDPVLSTEPLTIESTQRESRLKRSADLRVQNDDDTWLTYRSYRHQVPESKVALGELKLEYEVEIYGDVVEGITYHYQTPAAYDAWHQRQEMLGWVLTGLSVLFSFVLFVLAFVFVFLVKERKPWWSALGLSLVIVVLFGVANLNEWPTILNQFVETGTLVSERTIGLVLAVFGVIVLSVLMGAGTYVMILTGGALVKQVDPSLWKPHLGLDWRQNLRGAMWRGYALAFVWLALQGVFYLISENVFGVWYENDFSMSPVNMWFPLLFPLLAWLAGIQEEAAYRLFGVTFFKRYWKSSLLACLLPAMIWALGHSLYPVYPMYTRFIELTLFGLLIGYCYLWWGFGTVVFAHVVFDTVQMVLPFFFGGIGREIAVGVVYLLLPIVIAYGLSWVRGSKQDSGKSLARL